MTFWPVGRPHHVACFYKTQQGSILHHTHFTTRGVLGDAIHIIGTGHPSTTVPLTPSHWLWMDGWVSRCQFELLSAGVMPVVVGVLPSPCSMYAWIWCNYGVCYLPSLPFYFFHDLHTGNMSICIERPPCGWWQHMRRFNYMGWT